MFYVHRTSPLSFATHMLSAAVPLERFRLGRPLPEDTEPRLCAVAAEIKAYAGTCRQGDRLLGPDPDILMGLADQCPRKRIDPSRAVKVLEGLASRLERLADRLSKEDAGDMPAKRIERTVSLLVCLANAGHRINEREDDRHGPRRLAA